MPTEPPPTGPLPIETVIDRLSAGLKPVRRRSVGLDATVIGVICVAELALFLGMGAMRPDMPVAMSHPSFWWKLIGLALIAAVSGTVALLSFDPARSPHRGLRGVMAIVAGCLAVGWALDASRDGWTRLAARLDWHQGMHCVVKMVLLSIPAVLGLGVLMQRGAPTSMRGTAWAVGTAAAAWGAFVFVFACPSDDPLYIAVWYLLACLVVAGAARLLLPRLTRW